MTDKEIIKALECCSKKICNQCPNYSENIECSEEVIELSIDLINRQNAEIEQLKKEKDNYKNFYKRNKILLTDAYKTAEKVSENWEYGKSEKIKEFAERLKDIYRKDKRYDRPNAHTLIDKLFCNIDDLVKEMTEGSK